MKANIHDQRWRSGVSGLPFLGLSLVIKEGERGGSSVTQLYIRAFSPSGVFLLGFSFLSVH